MSWKWKGQGREGGKREERPHKVGYVKGRDKQFTAASSQRIPTRVVEEAPVTPFLCGGISLTGGGIH